MRALLDVNLLIALLDPDHVFHSKAHAWWFGQRKMGWASCPLSENGLVRVMSNPSYSPTRPFSPTEILERLREFVANTNHEFWPDDVSLRDSNIFTPEKTFSSSQITDLYLLALATKHRAILATFDKGISTSIVRTATSRNYVIL